ncbi:MAG TPA: choice-of-anchor Q domain-containing protein [Armatimonadota bacterium]|jgi:hypothetical protein
MNVKALMLVGIFSFALEPVLCPPTAAAVLHVSQGAEGPAHDGLSWLTAYLAVPDAVAAANAGDEIWVAAGTYTSAFELSQDTSVYGGFAGTESERTQRDPELHPSLMSGTGFTGINITAAVSPVSVIDGFIFNSAFHINLSGGSPTVSHNTFQGTAPGIGTDSNNYPASDARILYNTFVGFGGSPSIFIGGGNPIVQGNTVTGGSIWCGYGDPYAGPASPIVIGNYVSTGNYAIEVGGSNAYVASNVAVGAELHVSGSGAIIVNNTVVGSALKGLVYPSMLGDCVVANNLVAFNKYGMVPGEYSQTADPVTLFNNCVYGNSGGNYPVILKDATGFQGNISVDPQLVSRKGDFHLAATSPLIDAGNDAYVQSGDTDAVGKPRIQGAHVDIGAYEFGGSSFTMGDVAGALRLWGGLSAGTPDLSARLDVEAGNGVNMRDAVRLARKAAGLEQNP